MLKSIQVSNFKSFGGETTLEFRPITLLYGRNSSGKSSVFHLLRYLQQIFSTGNLDPAALGIGDFASVVHGQMRKAKTLNFRIEATWNLSVLRTVSTDLEEQISFNRRNKSELPDADAGELDFAVEFTVSASDFGKNLGITRYSFSLASQHVITVRPSKSGDDFLEFELNLDHLLFRAQSELIGSYENYGYNDLYFYPVDDLLLHGSCFPSDTHRYWFDEANQPGMPQEQESIKDLAHCINSLMLGSVHQVRSHLEQVVHIGPLRNIPTQLTVVPDDTSTSAWYDGSAAWGSLSRMSDEDFSKSANWIGGPDKLDLKYGLHRRQFVLAPVGSPGDALENETPANELKDDTPPNDTQTLSSDQDIECGPGDFLGMRVSDLYFSSVAARRLLPNQLGVGISQVVPIVAAVLDTTDEKKLLKGQCKLLMIEQPELHLHPEAQAALADLFVDTTSRGSLILIIETHSEPFLRRLLRRIAETTRDASECPHPLNLGDISVQHFSLENGASNVRQIAIADDGTLADDWPDDLLSLSFKEAFGR